MVVRDDVRVEYGKLGLKGIHLGLATSDDGIHWDVRNKPFISQQEAETDEIERFYDPRLTVLDGELYMCFAIDTKHGLRGGMGKIHDLEKLEILSMTVPITETWCFSPKKSAVTMQDLKDPCPFTQEVRIDLICGIPHLPTLNSGAEVSSLWVLNT